jgi:hypothetical protein
MKTSLCFLLAALGLGFPARAATTINPGNAFAYGANLGWIDGRGDVANGAVIGEFVCSGYLYAANAGWISLGGGAPANGIRYQNNSAGDFGVNHDGLGNLHGQAFAANLGWLTFTNRDALGAFYDGPKVDLFTGRLSGSVWSANAGWISLSNAQAFVQTDALRAGPDTDGDGIPDAWERLHFGNLTSADATSDADGDGLSDRGEYLADTDPLDPNSTLRITSHLYGLSGSPVTLTWQSRPTRLYRALKRTRLEPGFSWSEVGLGTIYPDAGTATTRAFGDSASPQRFFAIEAFQPLAP